MRLDRFITLRLARPLRTMFGRSRQRTLPVLMYHSISDRDESHLRDYFKVCTPPERFRLHMQTLKDHGYIGVDLETGLAWLNHPEAGAPVSDPARMGGKAPTGSETTMNGASPLSKGESGPCSLLTSADIEAA